MAELIFMTYEQARAEHFKALKDEAKRKMNYWATRVRRSRPNDLNDPAHIKAIEYGMEYSYYNDALEALAAQPKWISVEERLPEKSGRYLINLGNGWVEECWFDHLEERWEEEHGDYSEDVTESVTHWMPLPEPPKEEA